MSNSIAKQEQEGTRKWLLVWSIDREESMARAELMSAASNGPIKHIIARWKEQESQPFTQSESAQHVIDMLVRGRNLKKNPG